MYKLLALDLDGTTLTSKHIIDSETKKHIKFLINKGIKVTIISGREPKSIVSLSDQIGLNGLVGSMNGAIITTSDGVDHIMNLTLPEEHVKYSIDLSKRMNFNSILFIENDSFIASKKNEFGKIIDKFTDYPATEVGDLDKFLKENNLYNKVNKVAITDEYENLLKFKSVYEKNNNSSKLFFSLPFFLEINRNDISKGRALEYIADSYNINREEIVAIGDGENDIEMIQYAGKGVAMKNAMTGLKDVADEITDSNDNHGVVKIIKKYFL
ncbi:Cof-type HAD-IIB family hydrolase [Miniphocaeibacter halophilus]|uniref:HAD family phosphatase n=1 Tax=Miniphocaeibacter halophilus TaxID=2931922 RepID=A0AC61MQ21_9FIRM|nr:Cof-type HAD-IIB family hydrolase [Miniphocaeibacter halophilus]QQK07702.1 HAD family phosphatase [Miniphocaeibacter halophilus]